VSSRDPRSPPPDDPRGPRDSSARFTLPPPDIDSKKTIRPERPSAASARTSGRPWGAFAQEATLLARIEEARRTGEREVERLATAKLARWLASNERDLEQAVALALHALGLKDDFELRRELATWLEGLGDAARAAEIMAPVAEAPKSAARDDEHAASILVRIGVLNARAAEAGAASDAFVRASRADAGDALSCELRGSLAAWAPEIMPPDHAAEAYLDAAERREQAGEVDAQLEDLWRAFDADPAIEAVASALSTALVSRGRRGAADEATRAHAWALRPSEPDRALRVNTRRRREAISNDDLPRALSAALDEELDREIDGVGGDAFDELLARAGLLEPLAARLELRAERAKASERAHVLEELGRLFAGPLSMPDRAVDVLATAMAVDPSRTEALVALRAHSAQRRDPGPLVDALTRALATEGTEPERAERGVGARIACARTLIHVAEEELADPALAAWAAERLLRLDPEDAQARASLAKADGRRAAARERLDAIRALVADTRGNDRIAALRALAAALRGAPLEGATRARVLAELASHTPDDRPLLVEAYRTAWGRGDRATVHAMAERQLATATEAWQRLQARRNLAAEARSRGAWSEANNATRALLDEAPDDRMAASVAWTHAAVAGDRRTRARAMAAIAASSPSRVRAAIHGAAASALHDVGDEDAARRSASLGTVADPNGARCIVVLAEAAGSLPNREAASAYERAIAAMGPRASWCAALADALDRAGDANDAVTWTQRLVSLRPGDPAAIEALLSRTVKAGDASRVADALAWSISQAQPAGSLAAPVASALRALAALDASRASVIARRALDVFGPRHDMLRDALAYVAETARDDAFGAAIVERWIAIGAPTADRGALHADLVKRRARMGDRDGEARAIARAMRDGFDVRGFEANLDALAEARLGPDAEIAFLEARATLAVAKGETAVGAATLRQLGASLWELAQDRARAARAFVRAVALTGNAAALGADLAQLGDPDFSLGVLLARFAEETIPARAGGLAAEAARAALALGNHARAFDLAVTALQRNPSLADALEIAERGSASSGRALEMSPLYDAVGARALGRFGRRAAHYRAARFFEQRGDAELALKHAAEAFVAVPSEGTTFFLLARAASRASDTASAVRTIERVAAESGNPQKRAAWLLRAASILGTDEEGMRERVDVLLRASLVSPDLATLALLADAARALLSARPDEREPILLRFARAAHKITEKGEGPDGGRVALTLAGALLSVFADVESSGDLILRALSLDADLEEFAKLIPFAARIAASDGAQAWLGQAVGVCDKPYANVGAAAWRLIGAVAEAFGDHSLHGRAMVAAATRDPDDDALVRAADAAARASDDPTLAIKLAKRVSNGRRAEALLAHARELVREGANELAIDPLERALDLATAADAPALEAELRRACEASGRTERLEERALRGASDANLSPTVRADRWSEIAASRERRGDIAGAASALFEGAVLEPTSVERWSAVERIATEARRHDLRAHALEEIASRVEAGARIDVMRRLARAHEEAGDARAAEHVWQEVWDADPADEEADRAIETAVVGRGDYVALAEHLGRRAARLATGSGSRDALRALRLRRAVILEQRLNRADDAAEELTILLSEFPDNENALSYLADLYDRIGASGKAAILWRKVASLARDPSHKLELELRAASASRAAGNASAALEHVRAVLRVEPAHREATVMRVDLARAAKDDAELGLALEQLSTIADDLAARCDLLVEAAQAAARAQDAGTAVVRAQKAAKLAPTRPSAQLYARGLEYRVRGAGSPDDARATIEELGKVNGALEPDDAALQAFLLAEAFDARQGGGAGMHRLLAAERQFGPHAILSMGLGERLVAQWKFADAVPHFARALGGDLLGLRKRGAVALAGADAALRVDDREAALRFLDLAALEVDSRQAALRKLAAIVTSMGDMTRSRAVLLELARAAKGEDRARTLAQLARLLLTSGSAEERLESVRIFEEAIASAPGDGVLRAQLENELISLRLRPSAFPRSTDLQDEPSPRSTPVDFTTLERAAKEAQTPSERSRAQLAIARGHIEAGAFAAAEPILWAALDEGSAEAGEILASFIDRDESRTGDRVKLHRSLVDLVPGHVERLEALRAAAMADHNLSYARAVEHVLRAFDPGAGPLPPPPLTAQLEQPGILAHLTRPSRDANTEPLGVTWDAAFALFAKTPIAYAITGVERVTPGPASPLARLYEAALRVLGFPKLPLFYRRTPERLISSVALTHPASALLTGDAHEDTLEARHALGFALSSALPSHVLLLGLDEAHARTVWSALLTAFGPAGAARGVEKDVSRVAEQFWSAIPPRAQRRLKELLASASPSDFDLVLAAARQSSRRVALFVGGDFGFAAREFMRERNVRRESISGDELRLLCAEHAPLADLLRLAVSPEYADARWHPAAPGSPRGSASSSRRVIL
jgi:hypothetical protein